MSSVITNIKNVLFFNVQFRKCFLIISKSASFKENVHGYKMRH
jgi:hypothetical protein